ncbi:UDP-glucuronic acid decarboxylase family protein [Methanobacterium aggregans]|uniref:UDP-glucuronic acid decarboxylase family protein n=1 Tax=Methanobacterium aggregans TaxID=1615586 RepID=UPI001AE4E9B9|nr:UDP-glucuronic acid decarboxylase family protein [Methanobacterium aggregans]MBP2045059.1 nucleoside-diphosphate-sugar epimerase [Methanobacterium aggregans]
MKTVLIAGAAGFIGSHLCDNFLKEGFKVIGIDNFISGNPNNLSHLKNNKNFKFVKQDLTDPIQIDEDIDLVLHFASPASPVDYLKYPVETLEVNSIGTLNLLNLSREKNSRYLLASTSETYGDPLIHPQPESYWGNVNPVGPRSVYDEGKRFSEAISMAYHRTYHLDVRIIRVFNTYGPRMKIGDGRVVPNFISQALNGENITIYGDGSQTRSFCYIDDLIEGIFKVALSKNIEGELFNLGCPEEYKIIDFAEIIIEKTNSNSKISYKTLPVDDPKRRCPDISKVEKVLGWEPKITLDEGITKTIEFFKSKLNSK